MKNSSLKIILMVMALILPSQLYAKKEVAKELPPETAEALGPALLLIGTSSAETVDNVLKGALAFGKSVEHFSSDERNFLFGYANYRLGKWGEAEDFFKKCGGNEMLADHVLFYRGRIAIAIGENERAEELLTQLVNGGSESVWANDAKRYLAEAKINLRRFDEARRLIEQYLKGAALVSDVFAANLLLARSYIVQGDEEEALLRLRNLATSVISENDLTEIKKVAYDADKKISSRFERWLKEPSTQYDIAQSLMEHSQWADALSHIENVLSADGFEAKWLKARCQFKAHHYKEVIPLLEDLLKNGGSKMRLILLQHLASAYARVDDYKRSIELRRKIIREYSNSPSVVLDSQSKIAFLLLDDGHYNEAIDAFQEVLKLKGSAGMRTKTLWYMAWSYYKLKDFDSAIRMMNNLSEGKGKKKSKIRIDDRIAYWKARSYENSGRHEEARAMYREILRDHPIGYYGVLSKRRLNGDIRSVDNFVDMPAHKWPKNHFSVNVPRAETVFSQSPHLAKAIVFDDINLHDLVAKELQYSTGSADTNLVMWLASKNFVHDIPYVLAHQRYMSLLHSLPQSDGFERFVWEQSYPEAYRPVVERLVRQRFDPKLVYAIMRAESTFRPAVVSPSGAIGLMQLMPVTAQKMSSELGEANFDVHELYRPAKNIEYGIQYLRKLYGLFPGNTVAVIASYNAGEEAVGRWLLHGYSPDIEEFIEEIPYDETNLYVKKVMMNYWILQQMYSN